MVENRKSDGYKTESAGGNDGELETPSWLKEVRIKIF